MVVTANIVMLRSLLLTVLLIGLWKGAYAQSYSTPTDWIPQFGTIRFDGQDVVFDADAASIRLRNGQWRGMSSLPINTMVQKQNVFVQRNMGCYVPYEILSRYGAKGFKEAAILHCELPEKIWFATSGYCGGSGDDPKANQGRLYSYFPGSGKVLEYPGFLPRCASLAGSVRVNNKLLAVTLYRGIPRSPGQVMIFDLAHPEAPPKVIANPKPTGAVVGISAYERQCDCLWFATTEGIERLTIGKRKWERRYLDYKITTDNRLLLTLSIKKPSAEKMWLGRILYNYPIGDLRGFMTAWEQSPVPAHPGYPRTGSLLLPFYIAAIERTQEGWDDGSFGELMRIVAAHQDSEGKEVVRDLIEKLLKQPMNLSRRQEVISSAKIFGVNRVKEFEAAFFDDLMIEYFSGLRPNHHSSGDAVRLSFKNPEYLPKLRDYYLTHMLTYDVEKYFLDSAYQYRHWPGYDIVAAAVDKGLKQTGHRLQLLNMCNNNLFGDESKLLTILRARLETDAQAKLTREKRNDSPATWPESACINASRLWIYGDEEKVRARALLMLEAAAKHKEFSPIVLEILNYKFGVRFRDIEDWMHWRTNITTQGGCSKEMKTCGIAGNACVSMGVPDGAATCDSDCQAEALGKLFKAGVSVYAHMGSPKTPLGCVGYRKDLGGTEAGAKCIARVLGYEYHSLGCNDDGWPYNVRVH